MSSLPTGTVTFLLTDVEGSTAAWERDPDAMRVAMAELDRMVTEIVTHHAGAVVKPRGEGDSHFCVFATATDAVAAGVTLLRRVPDVGLSVRAAVHTGETDLRDGDYYGRTVNRAARLRSAGHGGQLLVSEVSAALVREGLADGIELRELGLHRLKDLSSPESIFEAAHPELPPVDRPLSTLDALRNNLPLQLTPLIGREELVTELLAVLTRQRLVTLVALGGAGKTRLALQVAAEAAGEFPSGVWYAELAPLHDASQVAPAILAATGGMSDLDDDLAEATNSIAGRQLLLVLDNCEHLIDTVAHCVEHLLTRCPRLKVLATTRQPLGVAGESVFRVPPLALPSPDDDLESIAGSPAVQLFLERGRAADPSLELSSGNAGAIARLCVGLDGLPLAIELAASRLKVLDPDQILQRFADRLTLLDSSGSSGANRTVRAAVGWSYDLLKPDEATLLRRLAIFEGPVGFDAVERVCGEGIDDVALALASLVDHSLVAVDTTVSGRRYRLLDLVRAYAGDLFRSSGERVEVERARARWVDELVEGARAAAEAIEDYMPGKHRLPRELGAVQADIEAALAWTESGEPERLADRVLGVGLIWRVLRSWTLAAKWVARALELQDPSDRDARMRLLLLGGGIYHERQEYDEGRWRAEEGLALAQGLGDARRVEQAHNLLGACAWPTGDFGAAAEHFERTLSLARARPDGAAEAGLAAHNLGLVAQWAGDLDDASRWYELAAELWAPVGQSCLAWSRLGHVAGSRGDLKSERRFYERAIATAQAEGHPVGEASARLDLGRLLEHQGLLDEAEAAYRAVYETQSETRPAAGALLAAARLAARRGDGDASDGLVSRAFAAFAGDPDAQVQYLASAAWMAKGPSEAPFAYKLSRRLMDVAARDGTARAVAGATLVAAEAAEEVGRAEEARRLALRARAQLVALGEVRIFGHTAAEHIAACEALLAKLEAAAEASSLS